MANQPHHLIIDPWSQGLNVMRDVFSRWSRLDITQVGSAVAIVGTIPTAVQLLGRVWREAYHWVRLCFLAEVTIPGGDPLNRSVVKWLLDKRPRHHRSFTGRTQVQHARSTPDLGAALKKTRHQAQYLPHWHSRWFFQQGDFFIVNRSADSFSAALSDPSYDGIGGEELTVSCLGWSAAPIMRFIETCRAYTDRQAQFFVIIYARDRYGLAWKPKTRTPIRHLDTVHLDKDVKDSLISDVRNYLDPKTQKRYQSRSMPYRRGYLFYGPPGTGKSSLSVAIAGEFGLDIYEVKIPTIATDADLEHMFQEIPPRCVVLLEDIDAVGVDCAASDKSSSSQDDKESMSSCTMSGLLNVLDGVSSQEGRIVIMTTNRPEQLNSALVRPGRVDMKVLLGNISQASSQEMFLRMFSPELGIAQPLDSEELLALAAQFARQIPEDTFTPSFLQGFFQLHLDCPREAAASIGPWVQKALAHGVEGDFEMVNRTKNG